MSILNEYSRPPIDPTKDERSRYYEPDMTTPAGRRWLLRNCGGLPVFLRHGGEMPARQFACYYMPPLQITSSPPSPDEFANLKDHQYHYDLGVFWPGKDRWAYVVSDDMLIVEPFKCSDWNDLYHIKV